MSISFFFNLIFLAMLCLQGKARGCYCWLGDCSLFGFPAFFTDREYAESI